MRICLPLAVALLLCAPQVFAAPIDVDQKPFLSATFKADKPSNNLIHRGVAVAFDGRRRRLDAQRESAGHRGGQSRPEQRL